MKHMKTWLMGAVLSGLVAVPALVSAGYSAPPQVSVYSSSSGGSGYGSIYGARNGAGNLQWIGCTVYKSSSMSVPTGYCIARDSADVVVSCSSTDWRVVEIMESVSATSVISFNYLTSGGGTCGYVSVSNTSYALN